MNSLNAVSIRQPDMHFAGSPNMVTNTRIAMYEDDPKDLYCTAMTYLLNPCTWSQYITTWDAVATSFGGVRVLPPRTSGKWNVWQPVSGDQTAGSYTRLVSTTVASHNGRRGSPSPSTVRLSPCSPFASTTPSTPTLASCLNHPPSVYLRASPFKISTIRPPPQQLASGLNRPPTVTTVYL